MNKFIRVTERDWKRLNERKIHPRQPMREVIEHLLDEFETWQSISEGDLE